MSDWPGFESLLCDRGQQNRAAKRRGDASNPSMLCVRASSREQQLSTFRLSRRTDDMRHCHIPINTRLDSTRVYQLKLHLYLVKWFIVKCYIALYTKFISKLRSVTRHMGSHSVTRHPTQVNAPSQIDRYSIYLLRRDGRLS